MHWLGTVQPSCLQEQGCVQLSCCCEQGSSCARGGVWFPPGAATGESEGSLLRAQGGLSLSPVPALWWQHRHGCATLAPLCPLCPTVAVGSPAGGPRHVPVPSLGSPVPHTSLQALGELQTTSHSAGGVTEGVPPARGCSCCRDPPPQLLVLGVSGSNPGITSHSAPSTARHDWGGKPTKKVLNLSPEWRLCLRQTQNVPSRSGLSPAIRPAQGHSAAVPGMTLLLPRHPPATGPG